MWGAIIGSLVGAGASGLFGRSSAKQQQAASRDAYQHRYQWTMQDLEKSGLNPTLAMNQGTIGGSPMMSQGDSPDVGSHIASGAQAALTQSTAKNLNETANAQKELAKKHEADATGSQLDNVHKQIENERAALELQGLKNMPSPSALAASARYKTPAARLAGDITDMTTSAAKDVKDKATAAKDTVKDLLKRGKRYFEHKTQTGKKGYGGAGGSW